MMEGAGAQKQPVVAPHNDLSNANFPMDAEGRVYHLSVKRGEVANRVLSVGEVRRAALLANFFDDPAKSFSISSSRGFVIHTGRIKGVPVSIVATGMGVPMIDFLVREARAVVDGKMVMARFGTCGSPQEHIPIGTVVATPSAVLVTRNVDAFQDESKKKEENKKALDYYDVSKPISSDATLTKLIAANIGRTDIKVCEGMDATADSFYGSQGRVTDDFDDYNATLLDELLEVHPTLATLEMETFHLLHMAHCSRGTISASAACIVLAQRRSNEFLSHEAKAHVEKVAGYAVLEALAAYPLDEKDIMHGEECVWNKF